MSTQVLLVDTCRDVEFLTENTSSGNRFFIEGPFLMTEAVNRNKRLYPKDIMEESVERYIKEYVDANRAIGELNHPDYPLPAIEKAALLTKSMYWGDGNHANDVIGKAQILNNPDGDRIRALMEAGFDMGVSSRALGGVTRAKDHVRVKRGVVLNAIDAVDLPSGQTCYVNALLESSQWQLNESGVYTKVGVDNDRMVQTLSEAHTQVGRDIMMRLERLAESV